VKPVFLDTVGLIAVWDESDQWHVDAEAAFKEILATDRTLVTTSSVLLECGNAAARRPYRVLVADLRVNMTNDGTLIEPTTADVTTGWADFRAGRSQTPGSSTAFPSRS
jgi:uncharacterized protein